MTILSRVNIFKRIYFEIFTLLRIVFAECSSKSSWITIRKTDREIRMRFLGSVKVFRQFEQRNRPSFNKQYLLFEHLGQLIFIPTIFAIVGPVFQTLPQINSILSVIDLKFT